MKIIQAKIKKNSFVGERCIRKQINSYSSFMYTNKNFINLFRYFAKA